MNAFNGIPLNVSSTVGSGWFERTFDPMKVSNAYNAQQAAIERNFNASEAQKQRDFEERMSNTAYQRAVADMRSAGLNPYLAATGSSASTPSGSAASAGSGARVTQNNAAVLGALMSVVGSAFSFATSVGKR